MNCWSWLEARLPGEASEGSRNRLAGSGQNGAAGRAGPHDAGNRL